jgi:hypothetical protein
MVVRVERGPSEESQMKFTASEYARAVAAEQAAKDAFEKAASGGKKAVAWARWAQAEMQVQQIHKAMPRSAMN